jgi:molecular chaperone GrpE (heat shock protein)
MKKNEEEEEDKVKFCILKVPIDASEKESKTYSVKIHKYDMDGFARGFYQVTDNFEQANQE